MKALLIIWRIIRWLIYFVLIMLTPFIITFFVAWIGSDSNAFAVQYKTDLVQLNTNMMIVKVSIGADESINKIIVDSTETKILFTIDDFGVSYYSKSGNLTTIDVETTNIVTHNIDVNKTLAVEASYLLMGSILLYIILFLLMIRYHKIKKQRKINGADYEDLASSREAITKPEDLNITISSDAPLSDTNNVVLIDPKEETAHDDELFVSVSDEEAIEDLHIESESVEETEVIYLEKEPASTVPEKKETEVFIYNDKANIMKETHKLVDIETKWCKILAEQGDKEAEYALAVYYAIGYKDIEKNDILAHYWLKKSADSGYEKAIKTLKENE